MPKTAVLCLGVSELNAGGWRDPEICKKYPGSEYLPLLASKKNIMSGGEPNLPDPADMLVVQEEMNPLGLELVDRGAKGAVLMCMEAPIFAPFFYDALPGLMKKFQFQFLFGGGTDPLHFPSFDPRTIQDPIPWEKRTQKFCMVMSNKHWKAFENIQGWKESPSWQNAVANQLHDQRFMAIHELQKGKLLDLYGKGWPYGMRAPEIPAGEKIETTRRYSLGLCIENMMMQGYVTEKVIDCIVAGLVPVYAGAPDIEKFIPKECFMPASGFEWPSAEKAWGIVQAGQRFLRSKAGLKFSRRAFARKLLSRIAQVL